MPTKLLTRSAAMLKRNLGVAASIDSLVITPVDGLGTITITDGAWLAQQKVDVTQPGQANARREAGEQEFIVPVSLLVRSSLTVLPAQGDRYALSINGTSYVFRVTLNTANAAYDFSDHGRTLVRVRTKKVP